MRFQTVFRRGWLLVAIALTACQPAAQEPTAVPPATTASEQPTLTPRPEPEATTPPAAITLTSTSFAADAEIPDRYACPDFGGEDLSPALAWGELPAGTQSLALTMLDPDAGGYIHWLVANIPPDATGFDEGQIPIGAVAGWTTNGITGYFGPCPEATHRYVFTLYALDVATELEPGFGLIDFRRATSGHILGEGQLVGLYTP
ncbi:MAG TPA: YbhB/YbcL family Raf kinase inhibitor-like protein [Anaerolineales bacterium]|nr:YbhB/YbcL family Raf kinase inhibitor-like protein [Anaerolineales bacterium]